MDINIRKLAENNPDVAGELLRELFFDQSKKNTLGCYNTFELKEGLTTYQEDMDDEKWTVCIQHFDDLSIFMKYHWDGDGTLLFEHYPELDGDDDWGLINDDCKKTGNWEFINYKE